MLSFILTAGVVTGAVKTLEDHEEFVRLARPYRALFQATGTRYGVNPHVLAALHFRESTFNPTMVGKAGEIGMGQVMQIAIDEAKRLGYTANVTLADMRDPNKQVPLTAFLLGKYAVRFGSIMKALRAYNVGPDLKDKSGDNGFTYAGRILVSAVTDELYSALHRTEAIA